MAIRGYVESGDAFTPEAVSAMGKAFEDATETLGVGPDELKRQAVAKFIVRLAQEDGNLDAAALRDRTVAALRDSIHAASIPEDEKRDANRT
jgi:hypothetical protein